MSQPSTRNLGDPGGDQALELPCFRDNVTVLVTVGEEKAEFYVHKQLLCDGSHFFRTALTGGYKETTEAAVTLPEDDPIAFECLLQFLYSGSYQVPSKAKFPYHYTFKTYNDQLSEHIAVYILAEKTQVLQLVKLVMDTVCEQRGKMMKGTKLLPSSDLIAWAYENTTSSSALRRFLVDCFVWHSGPLLQESLAINAEFAAEVAVGLQKRVFDRCVGDPFRIADAQSALGLRAPGSTTSTGLFLDGAVDPQVLYPAGFGRRQYQWDVRASPSITNPGPPNGIGWSQWANPTRGCSAAYTADYQYRPTHATNTNGYGPACGSLQRPAAQSFNRVGGIYSNLIADLSRTDIAALHRSTVPATGSPSNPATTQQPQCNTSAGGSLQWGEIGNGLGRPDESAHQLVG